MFARKTVGGFPAYQDTLSVCLLANSYSSGSIVTSGRVALANILETFGDEQISLWVPTLWCPEMNSVLSRAPANIKILRYSLTGFGTNELELAEAPNSQRVVVSYRPFGMDFDLRFPEDVVVITDSTHESLDREIESDFNFRSLRKVMPVSSGALIQSAQRKILSGERLPRDKKVDWSNKRHLALKSQFIRRFSARALASFRKNEERVEAQWPRLSQVDVLDSFVIRHSNILAMQSRRESNFAKLHEIFGKLNKWSPGLSVGKGSTPFSYPLHSKSATSLREILRNEGIFTPQLWKGIDAASLNRFETQLATQTIHFPLGAKYSTNHLDYLATKFTGFMQETEVT